MIDSEKKSWSFGNVVISEWIVGSNEQNTNLKLKLLFQKDKNWSVMKCLLAKLNGNGGGALLWAALNGNSEGVKQLLDAGVDVNSKCDIFFYFP